MHETSGITMTNRILSLMAWTTILVWGVQCTDQTTAPSTPVPWHIVLEPAADATYFESDTVEISCTIRDSSNGIVPVNPDSIVWSLANGEILGTGASITATRLPRGVNHVTVTVRYQSLRQSAGIAVTIVAYESARIVLGGSIRVDTGVYRLIGALWHDDSLQRVPVELLSGESGLSVRVSGADIYCFVWRGQTASYWRNGEEVVLSASGYLVDLKVSNERVHALGFEQKTGPSGRVYWNGNERVILPDYPFWPSALYCSGDTVIIAGGYGDHGVALWSQGQLDTIDIPDSLWVKDVKAIYISKAGIHLAIEASVAVDDMMVISGWYWHNGTLEPLRADPGETDPMRYLRLLDFCVYGEDVYAVGYIPRWPAIGYFWKNGVATKVATAVEDGLEYSLEFFNALAITHNQLFILGSYWEGGSIVTGRYRPCYWRGGRRFDLTALSDSVKLKTIAVAER